MPYDDVLASIREFAQEKSAIVVGCTPLGNAIAGEVAVSPHVELRAVLWLEEPQAHLKDAWVSVSPHITEDKTVPVSHIPQGIKKEHVIDARLS